MVISIKDKEYELHFGIKFIRELDERHFVMEEGVRFGAGLEILYPRLILGNPVILSEIIWTATNTLLNRPTPALVDEYIESVDDLDALFDEVISQLKNGKVTKRTIAELEKRIAQNQNAVETLTTE